MMPFRNSVTLETWLEEFRSKGSLIDGSVKVMDQDGDDGADTGLVGVTLAYSSSVAYIQPETTKSTRWLVTFEARDTQVDLDAATVLKLAAELTTVSALCAFLEEKSRAYVGRDAP
jgi:hypothetical protein